MAFIKKKYKKNKPHLFLFKYRLNSRFDEIRRNSSPLKLGFSFAFILAGISVFTNFVIYPAFAAQFETLKNRSAYTSIYTPVTDEDNLSSLQANFNGITFGELSSDNLKNAIISKENIPDFFSITIPKLDIYDAQVKTNSSTLDPEEYIGHYQNTCLPGEACNGLLYGHSTNTWVENEYKNGDYTAVFTRLRELEIGDLYTINYNGQAYNYKVDKKYIKSPDDINPLENPYDESYNISSTTLFTCDPPGTTKYRLHVVGKKIN